MSRSAVTTLRRRQAFLLGRFTLGAIGLAMLSVVMWLLAFSTAAPLTLRWTPVLIVSSSMEPTVSEGDVVIIDPDAEIGVGDVVTFEDPSGTGLITHRVVEIDDNGNYLTRGDANSVEDSTPVPPDSIRGRGRLLVPMAGLPWLWVGQGDWLALGTAVTTILMAMWFARWALDVNADLTPTSSPSDDDDTRTVDDGDDVHADVIDVRAGSHLLDDRLRAGSPVL